MNYWIQPDLVLKGTEINLLPMEEYHLPELLDIAGDHRIWQFYAFDGTDRKRMSQILGSGLADKEQGTQFPFVILHKSTGRLIGSTRYLDMQANHRKLEIGSTWLIPEYWAGSVNLECKLLLLSFCFEKLKTYRVQLKTDETNIRSRKAIEKIGGVFEGILRNDMIRDNGTKRNSAYYSIIDEEWYLKREKLEKLLDEKRSTRG